MKTLTVRLPEPLVHDIEAESRARRVSKSDVVRERLGRRAAGGRAPDPVAGIADLIGSVDGLPADLSSRTKRSLNLDWSWVGAARSYAKGRSHKMSDLKRSIQQGWSRGDRT